MSNVARDVLEPQDPNLLLRVVVLYVGQGSSTIIMAADGSNYQVLLLDIHLDEALGGIDVPALMADLLEGGRLDVFINSHPHNDHLCGVEQLLDAVPVDAVWHSGHVPSRAHQEAYRELQRAIARVNANGGYEEELCASRTPKQIGDVTCYVLSPAQHVKDSIDDETTTGRDRRIHEHCAVLRLGTGESWVMLPGDADRDAWEQHIRYHANYDALSAQVLVDAHHGSRTFFCYEEDDEPYVDGLESVSPACVIISAPRREESPHGHPHELALDLYGDEVGEENILHTGADRYSFVADIYRDGRLEVWSDEGQLVAAYGLGSGGDGTKSQFALGVSGPSMRRGRPRDVREAPPFA